MTKYTIPTYVYVFLIIILGILSAIFLFIFPSEREWDPWPFFFFGALAFAASSLSISFQDHLPSKGVIQISAAFVYALFFLIHPGGVAAILALLPLYDLFYNKRKLLTALFNIGQLLFALAIASYIWFRIGTDEGLLLRTPITILGALMSLIVFSLINHLLTNTVIVLATKKSFFKTGFLNKTALYNESVAVTLGLSMAALWTLYPPLAVLSSVPILILFLSLINLSKKEYVLTIRQTELASLNDLALEIGAELDMKNLSQAIVRIASKSVHASKAVLAFQKDDSDVMSVQASHGWEDLKEPPERFSLPLSEPLVGKDIYAGQISSEGMPADMPIGEDLHYLALPLSNLKDKKAMLYVFSGSERKSFDATDEEKIKNLGKFIDIALSNATLYQNLKLAQQRLIQSEKLSAVGMLVSGVAHELNSPLTSILGYSDLLYAQTGEESARKKLEKIASEAQRAAKIVKNLLTFARESKADKKPMNFNELIDKVLELKSYTFRRNKIKVVKELLPHLGEIQADSNQMQQVLLNIFNNAEHALASREAGRIITVKTFEEEGWIKIAIYNNGGNIPEENIKKIFLPFFTTKEVGRGTGLGLSICYGIIQEHKGKIAVENEKGGVIFRIDLPVLSSHKRAKDFSSKTSMISEHLKEIEGKKILFVEDEVAIKDFVCEFLSSFPVEIGTSCDGQEAMEMIRKNDYDLILLDIKMPRMDGMDFYRILKKENPRLIEKIMFTTGDATDEVVKRFIQSSGRPCLFKPFTTDALLEAISSFFTPVPL